MNLNVTNHEERVRSIICNKLAVDQSRIKANTAFVEDLGADSLDLIELVMTLEEEFDMDIPDSKAEKLKTVGQVVNYINERSKTVH